MKLHPKFRKCLEFDDVRVGAVYSGNISEVEKLITDEFSQMGLACTFISWDAMYKKVQKAWEQYGDHFFWERHPEEFFSQNSLNVIYDCYFGPKPAENPSKDESRKATFLGEFLSYYEGGSGRMSPQNRDYYLAQNIRIMQLFKSREEYVRHIRGFHTGREFAITCDTLFEETLNNLPRP